MLADAVGLIRSLENPTPARIKGLVKSLIDRILSDGNWTNATLPEGPPMRLPSVSIHPHGIHHHRIEYIDPRPAPMKTAGAGPRMDIQIANRQNGIRSGCGRYAAGSGSS